MNTSPENATRQGAWETAYAKGQNFVFYPHEEIIRFLARHVRRRTGLDSYKDIMPGAEGSRLLDVGCGIGRHLVLSHQMGFDTYGIDLSSKAISLARDWLKREGMKNTDEQVLQGDVRHLPWTEDYFQIAVSHGVFDSMPTEIARAGVEDLARVMTKGGLFYCDLVAGNAAEETVKSEHEKDTIQSYFDQQKIDRLFEGYFKTVEQALIHRDDMLNNTRVSRWHIILEKRQ